MSAEDISVWTRVYYTKLKGKGRILIYRCLSDDQTRALYNVGSGIWLARANSAAAQIAAIQLHALTYNWISGMQLETYYRSNQPHQAFTS